MVHAQQIETPELGGKPRDPPAETVRLHALPAIQRIAPALPLLRKIIRRHAGYHGRLAFGIEHEIFTLGPDIHAVVRHKDGHVAKQQHMAFVGMRPQCLPLAGKRKLLEAHLRNLVDKAHARLRQCLRLAVAQRRRPLIPGPPGIFPAQHAVKRIILQPVRLRIDEGLEDLLVGNRSALRENPVRLRETLETITHRILRSGWIAGIQPAPFHQTLQTDEHGVAGVQRQRMIG